MVNRKQRYKCHVCKKQFIDRKKLNSDLLWELYMTGKQTYKQLAEQFNCSVRTIQRHIDESTRFIYLKEPRSIVLLMDTTYWGRAFGVMLFKDANTNENLLKYYVKNETNALYKQGVEELIHQGFVIDAIVCDGRKGLIQSFGKIPVQMCQFHQISIIKRYLTKKPKMPASIELKEISSMLKETDKESFKGMLEQWFIKWESFLNERTDNPETGKSYYTHKRLRSAYRSLKTNFDWLFTWYDNMELQIPNTTNAIDGHFADLKTKMRNHNGMNLERKMKFIDEFLKA